ncbi:MAG: hypothetical protein MR579_05990 [Bacteroidales bacterium]|nr:hypothetical protein [Fournierella massiliensis]MCI6740260.1 hypothetical protein [Bacteroidales bacterium]
MKQDIPKKSRQIAGSPANGQQNHKAAAEAGKPGNQSFCPGKKEKTLAPKLQPGPNQKTQGWGKRPTASGHNLFQQGNAAFMGQKTGRKIGQHGKAEIQIEGVRQPTDTYTEQKIRGPIPFKTFFDEQDRGRAIKNALQKPQPIGQTLKHGKKILRQSISAVQQIRKVQRQVQAAFPDPGRHKALLDPTHQNMPRAKAAESSPEQIPADQSE